MKAREDIEFQKAVGSRLSDLLKEKGITQRQLARELGIPECKVSRYLRGEMQIPVRALSRMASILKVSLDDVAGWK